jgi:hypothetical protein
VSREFHSQGITSPLGNKIHSWGTNSPLGSKFAPRGEVKNGPQFFPRFVSGGALDLFYRFGFYSLSVRVVPRDDPGAWLIREPTARVFDDSSVVQIDRQGADTFDRQPFQVSRHYFPCDQLMDYVLVRLYLYIYLRRPKITAIYIGAKRTTKRHFCTRLKTFKKNY